MASCSETLKKAWSSPPILSTALRLFPLRGRRCWQEVCKGWTTAQPGLVA